MSEALQSWLRARLGVILDLRPDIFGHYTSDGTLLAEILLNYDIINVSQRDTIIRTTDPALCRVNLRLLRIWLRFIGIILDDSSIEEISCGRGTTSLQLFYKVYLCLENKDRLHFITLQKEREKFIPTTARFDVIKICEDSPPYEAPEHELSKPLVDYADNIKWHREKFKSILYKYKEEEFGLPDAEKCAIVESVEQATQADSETKESLELPNYVGKSKSTRVTESMKFDYYREDLDDELKVFYGDADSAKAYIKWRKDCKERILNSHEARFRRQTIVFTELWERLIEKEEMSFDKTLAYYVLNQSQYEKQMMSKLSEIRSHKHVIARNRHIVDNLIVNGRENEARLEQNRKMEVWARRAENVKMEYYRILELQRRLNEINVQKLKENLRYMCEQILHDFVDIAMRTSDCKENNHGFVPSLVWNEWKALFLASQPVFKPVQYMKYADMSPEQSEIPPDLSARIKIVLDADFQDYYNLNPPWDEYQVRLDIEKQTMLEKGHNVLGYIIHRLLDAAYPRPTKPANSQLSDVKSVAILLGVIDVNAKATLRALLKNKNMHLIQMEDAINYCLQRYKEEIENKLYPDLSLIKATNDTMKQLEHEQKLSYTVKVCLIDSKENAKLKFSLSEPLFTEAEKSRILPTILSSSGEPSLSSAGYIGKWAYEFLALGQPISDELSSRILVEYLKDHDTAEGLVLIDFPSNYKQMVCLESALTGTKLVAINKRDVRNVDDVDTFTPRIHFGNEEGGSFASFRKSKLMPDPLAGTEEAYFTNTFMTTYIRLIPKFKLPETEENYLLDIFSTDAARIDSFYASQGIANVIYSSKLDTTVLKKLAEFVTDIVQKKVSFDVGDTLETSDIEDLKLLRGRKSMIPHVMTRSQHSIDEEEEELSKLEEPEPIKSPAINAVNDTAPGGDAWEWIDFPLAPELMQILASFWENIEDSYISSLNEICLMKRVQCSGVLNYQKFITKHLWEYIHKPDTKQDLLHKFHCEFNDIDDDFREDVQVKYELHCRVAEFQAILWHICDMRRTRSEEKRRNIILNQWVLTEAIALANMYIFILQIEMDRCTDTLDLLQDYYLSMLEKPLPNVKFPKITLNKVDFQTETTSPRRSIRGKLTDRLKEKESEDHLGRERSFVKFPPHMFHDDLIRLKEEITTLLTDTQKKEFSPKESAIYVSINNRITYISRIVDLIPPLLNETLRREEGSIGKPPPTKGKDKKDKSSDVSPISSPAKVRDLLEEWRYSAMAEIYNMRLRLDVLSAAAQSDIIFLLNTMRLCFHQIHIHILERFEKEIKCVNDMATVFSFAIEEAIPIQQEMLLDDDHFVTRSNVLMFPDKQQSPLTMAKQIILPYNFTAVQLESLVDIFKYIAPTGYLSERSFVYILQDLVTCGTENNEMMFLPSSWLNLQSCDISNLVEKLFGFTEYIDWREFIFTAINLPIPTYKQILVARDKFRAQDLDLKEIVTHNQYHATPLWFLDYTVPAINIRQFLYENMQRNREDLHIEKHTTQFSSIHSFKDGKKYESSPSDPFAEGMFEKEKNSPEELKKLMHTKDLLFRIYLSSRNLVNYTVLLLTFCKNEDPQKGFGKALSLVMGKHVCTNFEEGEKYVRELIEQKEREKTYEFLEIEVHQIIKEIVNRLLDKVIRKISADIESTDVGQKKLMIQALDENEEELNIDPSVLLDQECSVAAYDTDETDGYEITPSILSVIPEGYGRYREHVEKTYWIPRHICLAVLATAVPSLTVQPELFETSMSLRENVYAMYKELMDEELNETDDTALAHRLIAHDFIREVLANTTKFSSKHIKTLLINVLFERNETKPN